MKLKLLDLFAGVGGAGEGYRMAGFAITAVDNKPQPNNPHYFIQADALEYLKKHGHKFDVIHASPPCSCYSSSLGKNTIRTRQRYTTSVHGMDCGGYLFTGFGVQKI